MAFLGDPAGERGQDNIINFVGSSSPGWEENAKENAKEKAKEKTNKFPASLLSFRSFFFLQHLWTLCDNLNCDPNCNENLDASNGCNEIISDGREMRVSIKSSSYEMQV